MAALKGLEYLWYDIGDLLFVPYETRTDIRTKHSTVTARLREILHYVLSIHPYAGWRIIIWALHWEGEQRSAARIQEYAEPVTGTTSTT